MVERTPHGRLGELALIHLVWAPLGPDSLRSFVQAYRQHPAGVQHRLLVVYNGFTAGADLGPWRDILEPVRHSELTLGSVVQDLTAYAEAVRATDADTYCFLNSYSEPLVGGWLGLLTGHLRDPAVALVGATGSYESFYSSAHWWARPLRRGYPAFPNPHIRTNAFAVRRADLSRVNWRRVSSKAQARSLESGRDGLTRQLERLGRILVAGRNGHGYAPEEWRASATFRCAGQTNLLVADNRTRQYEAAGPDERRTLEERAWGRAD